jgi:hypothetical protein
MSARSLAGTTYGYGQVTYNGGKRCVYGSGTKGATFLACQDVQLGSAAPAASAMQTEAATALARVP